MTFQPAAKIVRIKGIHMAEALNLSEISQLEVLLRQENFIKVFDDGFYSSYGNEIYTNQNRNTLVYINFQEMVAGGILTIGIPD